jgi:hypothetical protein
MPFEKRTGKIMKLRTNDLNHVWGPPEDAIHTEVVVVLDSKPDSGFGFELREGDPNLPSRMAMLSMLRHAYMQHVVVTIWYDIVSGKKNGHLRRIQFG